MKRFAVLLLVLWMSTSALAQDEVGLHLVSTLDYWGAPECIQTVGNLAYVVAGNAMHIVDVSDPVHPVELGDGQWYDESDGSKVSVAGNRAYVSTGMGVSVFDIQDPTHPVKLVDWWPLSTCECRDILVVGNTAVVEMNEGLVSVDVSDVANMHIVASWPGYDTQRLIGMAGDYVCVVSQPALTLWDIRDPAQPVQVAAVDSQYYARCGTIVGNRAYVSTFGDGVRIVDISNPLLPVEIGSFDSSYCWEITVTGNQAIVSKGPYLNIWNVSDPSQPVYEGSYSTPETNYHSLSSSGNYVFAGAVDLTEIPFWVLDISEPCAPVRVAEFGRMGSLHRFVISDSVGYISGAPHAIDLAYPPAVKEIGTSSTASLGCNDDVAVRGHYAYCTGFQGLTVYDISDPGNPEFITAIGRSDLFRILIVGDYAYCRNGGSNLETFSLQDPEAPVHASIVYVGTGCWGGALAAANGYLYSEGEGSIGSQLWVLSLANPAVPQLVGSCYLTHVQTHLTDLAVANNVVYAPYFVFGTCFGMEIVDVSNPTYPVEAGWSSEVTSHVAAAGNVLITSGPSGLKVKDITDPIHPETVGYYTTDDGARDIEIYGSYILTSARDKFCVYACDALHNNRTPTEPPRMFALHPCYPNPFNPTTTIEYDLPSNCPVRLDVLDVLGRRVRQYSYGIQAAGVHELQFDGSALASGTYFVQLQAGTHLARQKMILLK